MLETMTAIGNDLPNFSYLDILGGVSLFEHHRPVNRQLEVYRLGRACGAELFLDLISDEHSIERLGYTAASGCVGGLRLLDEEGTVFGMALVLRRT